MKKKFSTYETLCKLPLGGSLWGLLFFFIFMLASCTNDVAEVETSPQQGQYVTVRMNIPGMTATATRAADAEIVKINALAFNESKELLEVDTIPISNNSRTFSLTVPNGTTTIHFLANLPDNYDLSGVNEEDDLRNLTSGEYWNTRYWGMTKYNGETELNNVVLYRDMARIKVVPADDSYTEDQIIIAGLLNPNNTGKIVPYNDGFNFDLGTYDYHTIPDSVKQNEVFEGTYSNPLYVFEHDNPATDDGLYVICKIAEYYYKIALLNEEGKPYDIIRNHEYTIYVSDLDVGATTYAAAKTADPINPPVVDNEIEEVTLTVNPTTASLYYDSDNTQQITVTVLDGKTLTSLTITPTVDCFTITPATDLSGPVNGVYTYAPDGGVTGSVTFTIAPNSGYDFTNVSSSILTFGGSGENMNVTTAQTAVTLSEKPEEATMSVTPENATINLDSSGEKSVILTLSKPADVTAIQINHAGIFEVTVLDLNGYGSSSDEQNLFLNGNALQNGAIDIQLKFTPKEGVTAGSYLITISEQNNETNSVSATIKLANLGTGTEIWSGSTTLGGGGGENETIRLSYEEISKYAGWTMTIVLTTEGSDWKQLQVKTSDYGTMIYAKYGNSIEESHSFTIPTTSELGLVIYGGGGITVTNIYVEETDAS